MRRGRRRIKTYRGRSIAKCTISLTALMLTIRLLYGFGAVDALDLGLKKLGENEDFVRGALSFELDFGVEAAPEGEADSSVDTDSSNLFLNHAALSGLDGTSGNTGSDSGQSAQTAGQADGAAGVDSEVPARSEVTLASGKATGLNGLLINNQTSKEIDYKALLEEGLELTIDDDGPQVLIYHTHGSEAYTPDGDDIYTPTDTQRTEDPNYNVLRVGRELARALESKGIKTIQATELHDYPSYTGSYARSLETVEDYLREYPSIKVVIDLHRDALQQEDGTVLKTVAELDGIEKTAQLLLVIGTDENLEHPNWRENLKLGLNLQLALNEKYPTLARPLSIRSSRFNQHVSPNSLLVEIGCSGNTLREAISCAQLFAEVLSGLMQN